MQPWLLLISTIATAAGAIVTAIATVFLWRVTKSLAIETKRLVDLGAQPHVVATIEVNMWSMMHADLRVVNTGNATAYDITIFFDPQIAPKISGLEDRGLPLSSISILRPGQELVASIGEIGPLLDDARSVEISWKRSSNKDVREYNKYTLDLTGYKNLRRLGGSSALTEIAEELRKIRNDLGPIARGDKRAGVDIFDTK